MTRPGLIAGLAASTALTLVAAPASAQGKPSLLDLISPDRIAARMLQMGIMGLRSQVDLVYGGMSVSALAGSATITDVTAWPLVDWDTDDGCQVDVDRLTLSTVPLDELDHVRLRAEATGARAKTGCLPPDMRGMLDPLELQTISLGRVTFDIDYTIPTAEAKVQAYLLADDLAAATLTADFEYLWFDARDRYADPKPVIFLRSARLTAENLGLWDKVKGMLPPPVLDPDQSAQMVDAFFTGMLPPPREGTTPSAERDPLEQSVKDSWAAFLADPQKLVLETSFDPAVSAYIDPEAWDRNGPDAMLDDLKPRMVLAPAPARALLPAALLKKAVDAPDTLSDDERLTLGTALATGTGVPRDLGMAQDLLAPAADAGNGEAALLLAKALENRDTAAAYTLALQSAAAGTAGAAGVLDRIEGKLPFARVLELQGQLVAGVDHPVESLASLNLVRQEAVMRMSGKGRTRSYGIALLWALIGSAAGDPESELILADIDQKVRLGGEDAAAVWKTQEAEATALARNAWLGFDLPTSFGGN